MTVPAALSVDQLVGVIEKHSRLLAVIDLSRAANADLLRGMMVEDVDDIYGALQKGSDAYTASLEQSANMCRQAIDGARQELRSRCRP